MVEAIAEKKCDAVAGRHPEDVVIGADTVVVFGGKVMGKPKDAAHAVEMLRALAGKRHTVYTGVCVCDRGVKTVWHEVSHVYMQKMSDEFIAAAYVAGGSPLDKGGRVTAFRTRAPSKGTTANTPTSWDCLSCDWQSY